jgi:energy-coupling factor transporter ATP-binding protein EcfA2
MKVVRLQAENVKKVTCIDITPSQDVVEISGKNGSGKSTLLDCIEWGLGGAENIQSMPIRNGERSARIKLDLGDIVVTRKFTEGGTTVTVENADGARYPSPQAMLDKLYGTISFDPLAFSRMKPRDQYEELRRIAGVTLDLESLDRANDIDYRRRTDLNKSAKAKAAQAQAFEFAYEPTEKPIDTTAIAAQMAVAANANQERVAEQNRRTRVGRQAVSLSTEIIALEEQLATKKAEKNAISVTQASWPALADERDLTEFQEQIRDANQRNAEFQKRQSQAAILAEVSRIEAESDSLTKAMAAREKQKADAIAQAEMPIEGISLGNGVVLFNNVPFEQASSGERLRTGVAIAMAGNPKLRVCLIRDASLLDEDGLAIVTEMAREKDFQVWVETVDSSGKVGIVLEDGAVVGAEMPTAPEPAKAKAKRSTPVVHESSGNVFADLGLENPGELLAQSAARAVADPKPKSKRKSLAEKLGKPAEKPNVVADAVSDGLRGAESDNSDDDEPWIVK